MLQPLLGVAAQTIFALWLSSTSGSVIDALLALPALGGFSLSLVMCGV